jgi:kumamolisin
VPATLPVAAALTLQGRDQAGLDALAGSNPHLSPAEYAARFGPPPDAVNAARGLIEAAGLRTSWTPGATQLLVEGDAASAQRLVGVAIHRYVGPDGTRFFAPITHPAGPAALVPTVVAVNGLDDYPMGRPRARLIRAIRPGGFTPQDALGFYDVQRVRDAGLDGKGITVVFPETAHVKQADLDAYAKKFNLPAFDIEQKTNQSWGQPTDDDASSIAEATMDVEVVHAIAPGAHLVVYVAGQSMANLIAAEQAAIQEHPGEILSSSIGPCEQQTADGKAVADAFLRLTQTAATTGVTFFDASGDVGAYGCAPPFGSDPDHLAVGLPNSSPFATSVGGTTVFLSKEGTYLRETCWGQELEFGGSGGGLSVHYQRPDWQRGTGVDNQWSNGMRQVPDVAALGDSLTGWSLIVDGQASIIAGTSASSPFWSGVTALINQNLKKKGLRTVGFANPALYYFGQNASTLPAPAYHDVTEGNNFFYPSTPGWDYCTGWGTPDVAALADDWEFYQRQVAR